eukprot:COSAG02_NODE_5961_length_3909_cov_1.361942_3_plen_310_part_00
MSESDELVEDVEQPESNEPGGCAKGFAYFLAFVALWNCVKIPFYIVLDPATAVHNSTTLPFGMENSVPLYYAFGYHGSKQAFNPQLFLAPHTAMGSSFFVMSAAYLLGSARFEPMLAVFSPVAIIFSVHTIPCRAGLSNRLLGWEDTSAEAKYARGGKFSPEAPPINEFLLANSILCGIVGIFFNPQFRSNPESFRAAYPTRKILWTCWAITLACMCLSPFADVLFISVKFLSGTVTDSAEGPYPSPESGKGFYYKCGCPFFGALIAVAWIAVLVSAVGKMLAKESSSLGKEGSGQSCACCLENTYSGR